MEKLVTTKKIKIYAVNVIAYVFDLYYIFTRKIDRNLSFGHLPMPPPLGGISFVYIGNERTQLALQSLKVSTLYAQ